MSGLLCLKWNNHCSSILKKLNSILTQESYSDVTLACHGNYYPVHRLVLSTCSEYFEEIFDRTQCKHPFIILKDINQVELEALLKYMYNGEVNVLQETLPGLIKAAEYLRIKGLAMPDEPTCDDSQSPPRESRKRSNFNSPVSRSRRSRRRLEEPMRTSTEALSMNSELSTEEVPGSRQVEDSGSGSNSNPSPEDLAEQSPNLCEVKDIKVEKMDFNEDAEERVEDKSYESTTNFDSFHLSEPFMLAAGDVEDSNYENKSIKSDTDFAHCSTWDEGNQRNSTSDVPEEETCDLNPPLGDRALEALSLALSMHEGPALGVKGTSSEASSSSPSKTDKRTSLDLSNAMYECCYCPYNSSSRSNWREHCFQEHPGNHLYACKLCKYQTSVKSLLNRHMLVHNGEKRFKCDFCPYRTAYSFNMKTHLYKHKEIPF